MHEYNGSKRWQLVINKKIDKTGGNYNSIDAGSFCKLIPNRLNRPVSGASRVHLVAVIGSNAFWWSKSTATHNQPAAPTYKLALSKPLPLYFARPIVQLFLHKNVSIRFSACNWQATAAVQLQTETSVINVADARSVVNQLLQLNNGMLREGFSVRSEARTLGEADFRFGESILEQLWAHSITMRCVSMSFSGESEESEQLEHVHEFIAFMRINRSSRSPDSFPHHFYGLRVASPAEGLVCTTISSPLDSRIRPPMMWSARKTVELARARQDCHSEACKDHPVLQSEIKSWSLLRKWFGKPINAGIGGELWP